MDQLGTFSASLFAQVRAAIQAKIDAGCGGTARQGRVRSATVTPAASLHRLKLLAALVAVAALILGTPVRAAADPIPTPTAPNEGGSPTLATLQANLSAAAEAYIKAEADLGVSQAKQATLQQQLEAAEADITRVKARVAAFAVESYRTGRITPVSLLLQATTTEDLIGRAQALDKVSRADLARLQELAAAKARAAQAKAGIDAEVAKQAAALAEMTKRKQAAEKSLAAAKATRTTVDTSGVPIARPAPRNADGSWPSESCSLDDPTTSGCLTPRTLHALQEAQRAGFTWYVSCYRPGDRYEHPKGRACDFAAFPGGFVNRSATGEGKAYGDRLAAFFVKNAKALGVMYVVWYCQIWQYSTGWHRYNSAGSNCGDDPAGDHTNHVHLSVY
jgi:peptidoglycan DL-endopeptidase CwlO